MWHADHTGNQTGNYVCDIDGAWKARTVDPAALGKTGLAFGCDDCGTVDTKMADGTCEPIVLYTHLYTLYTPFIHPLYTCIKK